MGTLFLIPSLLGDSDLGQLNPTLPTLLPKLKYFVVENVKSARRFLKKVDRSINIDELTFFELNSNNKNDDGVADQIKFLQHAINGNNIGLLSDAGLPAIADPGEQFILLAHQYQVKVVPLVGPSSILLALLASGLNGEQFTFHGYLPIQKRDRQHAIKKLEAQSLQSGGAQIFIETPYRNNQLLESIKKACRNDTFLCVASNLTLNNELIATHTIKTWNTKDYNFHKIPAVFVLQA